MPRFDKKAITQFVGTGCERQFRIGLHPKTTTGLVERAVFDLPHPQVRPALAQLTAAGQEWGEAKVWELQQVFGTAAVVGENPTQNDNPAAPGLRFAPSPVLPRLQSGVKAGQFLIEAVYDADSPAFLTQWGLAGVQVDELVSAGLPGTVEFAKVRPDVIEVLPAAAGSIVVAVDGQLHLQPAGDTRCRLRIIDVKLQSEPGAKYFAELAYYALTLAAFLVENHLDDRYLVDAQPAIWPGSEETSALLAATDEVTATMILHDLLVVAPLSIFVAAVRRILQEVLPKAATADLDQLPWAVTQRCQGCENLGQRFRPNPGVDPSDWDERHCLARAEDQRHLSRIPGLSTGMTQVLTENDRGDVPAVAVLDAADPLFDEHHRLRGQRHVVTTRAGALTGQPIPPLQPKATSSAIPSFAKLQIFVTADFDPSSAITLAFGFQHAWISPGPRLNKVPRSNVHWVETKTSEAEWEALARLLADIDAAVEAASALSGTTANGNAARDVPVQVYVWDPMTLDHLKRVVGRHLARIMVSDRLRPLLLLFPPPTVLGNQHLTAAPVVSVVKDAVTGLLSLNLPHVYTLFEVARLYQQVRPGMELAQFQPPSMWSDPFSDQIPPERAHQLWNHRPTTKGMTKLDLITNLGKTVRLKLWALQSVTGRLADDLRGRLNRRAPDIRDISRNSTLGACAVQSELIVRFAELDAGVSKVDKARVQALSLDERESGFHSARIVRRITDPQQRLTWLNNFDVTAPSTSCQVFELAPGSVDVKAKKRDISFAVHPRDWTYQLGQTVNNVLGVNDQDNRVTFADALQAEILGLDATARVLAVKFNSFRSHQRNQLLSRKFIQLDSELVLDPIYLEFFLKKLRNAAKVIGNPPSARADTAIEAALTKKLNPRTGRPHAAEGFLWDAATAANAPTGIDPGPIRAAMIDDEVTLNDSQWKAFDAALSRRLTLIWGPPGTGKTATVRRIVEGFCRVATAPGAQRPLRIAIAANTWTAVDNVINQLGGRLNGVPVVRMRPPADPEAMGVVPLREQDIPDAVLSMLDQPTSTVVAGTSQQLYKLAVQTEPLRGRELFDVLIIDEAGQLDVANALLVFAGLAPGASVIVAGDPLQLPPIHSIDGPEGLEDLVGPIFEFFRSRQQVQPENLTINYRSNAEIVELGRTAGYPPELRPANPDLRIRLASDVRSGPGGLLRSPALADLTDPDRPVMSVTYPDGRSGQWNPLEVDVVAQLVWDFATRLLPDDAQQVPAVVSDPAAATDFWSRRIGIVTPHRAQRSRIIARLSQLFPNLPPAVPGGPDPADVRALISGAVDTVERFQGQERDIIVASYAVGDPDSVSEEDEFLHDRNRFNVLATRAKAKLIVIAPQELVEHVSSDLDVLRNSEMIKNFVELFCTTTTTNELWWPDNEQNQRTTTARLGWR